MSEPIDIFSTIQPLVQLEVDNAIQAYANAAKYTVAQIPAHEHTGIDSSQISFNNLANRQLILPISISGTSAATATNYGIVFIAPFPCALSAASEVHQTAGTDGGSVTLTLEKLTGTQALDSGTVLLNSAFNLKSTANTVVNGIIFNGNNAGAVVNFNVGDRLALKDAGTLTSVAGVCLTLIFTY